MKTHAFTALRDAEQSWWYEARKRVVSRVLHRFHTNKGEVLDVGAGYGGMHSLLSHWGPVTAHEPYDSAREVCRTRGYTRVVSDIHELPEPTRYSLVGLFDVLEHAEDDIELLRAIRGHLTPDAHLAITVPAYPFLWGVHDVDHHHYRRYTKETLTQHLNEAGFRVEYISHWNTFLFPVALLLRLSRRASTTALTPKPFVNTVLGIITRAESLLIPICSLPFGLSLVAYARVMPPSDKN